MAQLLGNGILTFIHEDTKFNDFFKKDEMIFYKNIEDLSTKIHKFVKNDKDWRKIAKNGHKKYHKYFNSKIISKYIIDKTFGIKSKYFWE